MKHSKGKDPKELAIHIVEDHMQSEASAVAQPSEGKSKRALKKVCVTSPQIDRPSLLLNFPGSVACSPKRNKTKGQGEEEGQESVCCDQRKGHRYAQLGEGDQCCFIEIDEAEKRRAQGWSAQNIQS